jgi:hypothetical protein
LAVKGSEGRHIERIKLKPKAKVVFKPRNTNKEMLFGSVIWFKPKEEQGAEKNILNILILIFIRSQ